MYLKELNINGFKSFAKKSELGFTTPITAIVGPNGSGKSNVAEAFRFVLGEQSIKSMRGRKGEDLIFNGSTTASRANRASVTITLDNEKKVFPLDFNEISIERVVHRDGTNEYLINGSRSRLKDVQELLASANIGSTGHHIISQGEADRILTANPKERREMIEDALGLKVYQYKKAEAERKLKKTVENIAQVESLRREVRPHLKFLERQVKKIERSLALQKELTTFYCEYLKREDAYVAFHHDRLARERIVPIEEKNELQKELEAAKEKLKEEKQDETRDALVSLEEKIRIIREKHQEVVRESGQAEGQIAFLRRRIEERKRQKEDTHITSIAYKEVKKAADGIERNIEKALQNDDVSVLRRALSDTISILKTLLSKAPSQEKQETEGEEEELANFLKKKSDIETMLTEVEDEEKKLMTQYEELQNTIKNEDTESREAEREVFRIMNKDRDLNERITKIDEELRILERDRDEFKRELQEAASLLGTSVSRYFEYKVMEGDRELTKADFVDEERQKQVDRRMELEKMKIRLEELGMGATDDIEKEYIQVKERDQFLEREIADLTTSVEKLETLIKELSDELNQQFIGGIEKIDTEFSRFFMLMFGGGEAKLTRVKPKKRKKDLDEELSEEDPEEEEEEEEEGIEIDVKLPNKRVRGLDMLSGGERALTSIAVIFAMSQVNPPPFVILDETDAALDEANSRRYGDMIESLAKRSQLILITHNRETMSRAGVLYGVTMAGDGVSKLLSVKFDEAVAVAK